MKKEIDFTKLVHPESLEFSDVDDDSGAGDYDSSESEESGTDEKTIESAEEKENEPYSSDDETSYPASEDEDEEKKEEQDESDIDLSSGEESAMESVEAESDDGSKGLEDSDDSEDDSVDESDDETNVYGEIVDTHENPKFSTIFSLATKKMVTSAHVTDSKGNSIVYMLDEVGPRNRLKHLLQKKKRGYSWILRNNNRSANATKRERGLCEGFNPEPSSEEEESENESSEEENEGDTRSQAKQGKDSKLKNSKKKENNCKPSPIPKRKNPKDDEERAARKGLKPKSNTKTSTKGKKTNGNEQDNRKKTKAKQGKKTEEKDFGSDDEDDMDDEDSVDFGDPAIKENLDKQIKVQSRNLLPVHVSHCFHDVAAEQLVWVVFFGKPNNSFMLKGPHQKGMVTHVHIKRLTGNLGNLPKWIETVDDLKVRKVEHGSESKWYKTNKGNTTEIIYFVVSVPEDEKETFHDTLADIIDNYFIKAFKLRKKNPAGELALAFTESLADNSQADKGLYNWCVRVKGGSDPAVAARVMTKEIDEHFSGGPAFHYDVALDKFMVDWDIKQFLNEHVGINSWDDLDEAGIKSCFRNYPKRDLPEWQLIMQENY